MIHMGGNSTCYNFLIKWSIILLRAWFNDHIKSAQYILAFHFQNPNLVRIQYITPTICRMDHQKRKRVPEKHLLLLYWLHQSLCVDHNRLWEILREMGIPYHLTCLLKNLYAGQEATVRTGHGTTDWFQIGKGVHQGCIVSPCLFNLYAEYIMRNARLHKLESRLLGEISITSDTQMTPPLWQKAKKN